jgi:hypothetical protein
MAKLVKLDPKYWPREDFGYWCPGCNSGHEIAVSQPNGSGARWSFDGNVQQPTFSPSLHLKVNTPDMGQYYQPGIESRVCHCFIRAGRIEFLGDCTHALRGQTVELPDIPAGRYMTCTPA